MKKILSIAASAVLLAGAAVSITPRKVNATAGCAPEDVYEIVVLDWGMVGYKMDNHKGKLHNPNVTFEGRYGDITELTEVGRVESCSYDYATDREKINSIVSKMLNSDSKLYHLLEDELGIESEIGDNCVRVFNIYSFGLVHEVEIEDEE